MECLSLSLFNLLVDLVGSLVVECSSCYLPCWVLSEHNGEVLISCLLGHCTSWDSTGYTVLQFVMSFLSANFSWG